MVAPPLMPIARRAAGDRGRRRGAPGRRPLLAAVAIATAALAGCDAETGIIVEVTRPADATWPAPDRLTFAIGVEDTAGVYERDLASADVELADRDLARRPYRLFVRDASAATDPELLVAVVAYAGAVPDPVAFGAFTDPQPFLPGETVVRTVTLAPPAGLTVTGTGCVTWPAAAIVAADDRDCDGDRVPDDCDDADPTVGPSAAELCGNAVDDDCDGETDEDLDADADGVTTCQGDCDDGDAERTPGRTESCDGKDNDCNDVADDCADADADTYTACGFRLAVDGTCSAAAPDCDDADPLVHPGHAEVCDGRDNDCDGVDAPAQPCYRTEGTICETGEADCIENFGGKTYTVGTCNHTADSQKVSQALCDAYEGTCAAEPDPWDCANLAGATYVLDCQLLHAPDGTLCGPPRSVLVDTTEAACSWAIVSPDATRHYTVGLTSQTNATPVPEVNDCPAAFVVVDKKDPFPLAETVALTYLGNTGSTAIVTAVRIMPTERPSCQNVAAALLCN